MIIKIHEENLMAEIIGIDSYGTFYYFCEGSKRKISCKLLDPSEIVDNRFPPNWILTSYKFNNQNEIPDWLFDFYNDNMFFCHPDTVTPYDLIYCSFYSDFINENNVESMELMDYKALKTVNLVREFHCLEPIIIPRVEEFYEMLMSPEERRKKELSDELESYLALADEDKSNGLKG